ncbi:murein hydrolase activator EnvC [uncultured Gemmiger sp.]|uniref:murein hydrolase activator EnvC family protein n=1 Tax=uncultured Gemmiger sp. TaxID=1623490 RepID=UPI0025EE72E3|nr:M23 family metallopeptidase [uncultured Gemmiger sp.]
MKHNDRSGTAPLAAVLVFCILFSLFGGLFAPLAATKEELQQQLNDAKDAYDEAAKKQEEMENQAQQTQEQIGELNDRSEEISAQLSQVYSALTEAQTRLDEAQGEAEAAQAALEQKQAEYDTRWEESKEQLAAMQKLHYNGSLSILSQATNLFQLLNFSQALADITDKNTEVLTRLDTEAAELEKAREQAQAAADNAKAAQDELLIQEQALQDTANQLADALMAANADLDEQQAQAEAQAQITEEAKKAYQQATAELDAYAKSQNSKYTTATLYCSLDFGCALTPGMRISCNYGDPDGIDGSPHHGTDFPAAKGTPIYAVADGVVSAARAMPSYGNCVQISHGTADDGNNYATLYAHMSSIAVSEGQTVTKGQVIGYVGNTGDVSGKNGGYHLHLELRINGSRVNAMSYIPH